MGEPGDILVVIDFSEACNRTFREAERLESTGDSRLQKVPKVTLNSSALEVKRDGIKYSLE